MASQDEKKETKKNETMSESQKESSQKEDKKNAKSEEKGSSVSKKTQFSSSMLNTGKKESSHRNLGLVLDIPLKVTAELGRTRIAVRDLLNMGQGSIVELNKLAGEPMEIFVNEKLVAKGEAVVVNEKFGVRLIDIISPSERVEQLK